jgi:cytoskeletal protein CcmA (bactofilin family)
MSTYFNPNPNEQPSLGPNTEFAHPNPPTPIHEVGNRTTPFVGEPSHIGKGLSLIGEFAGSGALFIDGRLEGSISIPGGSVTVGRNGKVTADISAGEIVVEGKVRGSVSASDRVSIGSQGAVTGDLVAARLSIEDGAFFKGGIDVRRSEASRSQRSAGQDQGRSV